MFQPSPIGYANKSDLNYLKVTKIDEIPYHEVSLYNSMLQFQIQGTNVMMSLDPKWCGEQDKLELFEGESMVDICFRSFTCQINQIEFEQKFDSPIQIEVLKNITKVGKVDQCKNVTEEDFKQFMNFLYNGQLVFNINKLPVIGCMFLAFSLTIMFKHFVAGICTLLDQGMIQFTQTANYDDLLLLYLFSEYAQITPAVENEYKYFLTQLEYYLALADRCWFIDNLNKSPLFEVFTEYNLIAFQDNLLLRERIQNFALKCNTNEITDELMMLPMFMRSIIQVITIMQAQEKEVPPKPEERALNAGDMFNKLFPIMNLSETFFQNLKGLYLGYYVIDALALKVETQEEQIEQLQAYNNCLSLIIPKNTVQQNN